MRRLPAPFCLLFALLIAESVFGQKVVLQPPTLGDAERAYRDAQQEWLNADPTLAADLFKGNPQDIQRRIRSTAALRDEVMEKKAAYLGMVVKHFEETRARLINSSGAQLPIADLRKNLEDEQSRILGEMDRLDALILDLPQDDSYAVVLHELKAERVQLVNLQVTMAQQIRSVNSMGDAQNAAKKMEEKNPLDQKLQAIAKIWQDELDSSKVQREHWKVLYDAMLHAVDGGKTPAPSKTPGSKESPAGKPAVKPKNFLTPAGLGDARKPGLLEGAWNYESRPNAWIGFGEPVRVTLELSRSGTLVSGTYKASLPGRSDVRDLDLILTGTEVVPGKAVLQWTSLAPPAHGEMTVQIGGDSRVLVARTRSTDTYFPQGMEVLLPRQTP